MAELVEIIEDLRAEHDALDSVVAGLKAEQWDQPTPAEGWSIRDQITHLTFFDHQAHLAVADPEEFAAALASAAGDPLAFTDRPLAEARLQETGEVLGRWRAGRARMLETFAGLAPDTRIPWYGPPMSARSFVTARLMETWAHGQDIVDALGVPREATTRLRHVAHLGVLSRPFAYQVRGLTVPDEPVRVELHAPDGDVWTWGEPGDQSVRGPALDFCLVVVQRRHVDDTRLEVEGEAARRWMEIAQAYAGPPGTGRRPGQFGDDAD
jgi:uncharacterized protein (TIGR03084 family)